MKRFSVKGSKGNTLLSLAYSTPLSESITFLLPEIGNYLVDIRNQQQENYKVNMKIRIYITSYRIDLGTFLPGKYQIRITDPRSKQFAIYKIAKLLR